MVWVFDTIWKGEKVFLHNFLGKSLFKTISRVFLLSLPNYKILKYPDFEQCHFSFLRPVAVCNTASQQQCEILSVLFSPSFQYLNFSLDFVQLRGKRENEKLWDALDSAYLIALCGAIEQREEVKVQKHYTFTLLQPLKEKNQILHKRVFKIFFQLVMTPYSHAAH